MAAEPGTRPHRPARREGWAAWAAGVALSLVLIVLLSRSDAHDDPMIQHDGVLTTAALLVLATLLALLLGYGTPALRTRRHRRRVPDLQMLIAVVAFVGTVFLVIRLRETVFH